MKKILVILSVLLINSSCIYYSLKEKPKKVENPTSSVLGIESETLISALIGTGKKFSLYGYGPPNSLTTISGLGIYSETYSQDNGYFEFKNKYLPLSSTEPCISAKDHLGRITMPICLTSIPIDSVEPIGPVFLPPSISADKSDYYKGDDIVLTGQTIPGSTIDLSMFSDKSTKILSMSVYALTLPEINIETDKNGNYSITFPSEDPESFRVFAQSSMNNEKTPKSNTMNVKVLPFWMLFVRFLTYIWFVFKQKIIEIIIISQIIALLIYLFRSYFHPHKIAVERAIVLRQKSPLMMIND